MSFEAPKTSQLAGLLEKLGLEGKKVLVLSHGLNRNLYLSGRNLPSAEVMSFAEASAYDVLWSDAVVVEQAALAGGEPVEPGSSPETPKAAPRQKPAKAAAKRPAAKAKKPAARKAPTKPAAKRSEVKKPAPKKKKES